MADLKSLFWACFFFFLCLFLAWRLLPWEFRQAASSEWRQFQEQREEKRLLELQREGKIKVLE